MQRYVVWYVFINVSEAPADLIFNTRHHIPQEIYLLIILSFTRLSSVV
jgi:hypothetical protein